jgi:hypothetical protein
LRTGEGADDAGNDMADHDNVLSPPEIQSLLASALSYRRKGRARW